MDTILCANPDLGFLNARDGTVVDQQAPTNMKQTEWLPIVQYMEMYSAANDIEKADWFVQTSSSSPLPEMPLSFPILGFSRGAGSSSPLLLPDRDILTGIYKEIHKKLEEMDTEWDAKTATLGHGASISDLLQHRYVMITSEEIDLYKVLYSNSLVLMSTDETTREKWYHQYLIPFTHYVPLDKDIADVIEWCLDHDEECRAMVAASTALIKKLDYTFAINEYKIR
jgi:hypothetical protein